MRAEDTRDAPEDEPSRVDLAGSCDVIERPGPPVDAARKALELESLLSYLAIVARKVASGDQGSPEGASDLVQMTVMAALENFAANRTPGDSDGAMKAWLRGIMINVHRGSLRRKRPEGGLEGADIASDTTSPSSKAGRSELVYRLKLARARLTDREREVIRMRIEEKRTFEEIGKSFGISAVAAHKAHARAVKRLEVIYLEISAAEAYRRSPAWLRAVNGDFSTLP